MIGGLWQRTVRRNRWSTTTRENKEREEEIGEKRREGGRRQVIWPFKQHSDGLEEGAMSPLSVRQLTGF